MSQQTPTAQQFAAVNTRDVSIVLSAGAGSGKTQVLTNRYLSHLEREEAAVGQLVAITFTDRAAREMRGRIRKAMTATLRQSTDDTAARWAGHLQDLESATISTIHSFCGNLIRQHAVQAGLDPRFEVLEEVLANNIRTESMRTTLQQLLVADTLTGQSLRELVELYGWRATRAGLDSLVGQADLTAWTAWLAQSPQAIEKRWLEVDRPHLLNGWIDYLLVASPPIAGCLSLLKVTPTSNPAMRVKVERILELTPKLASCPNLEAAIEELKECAKVGHGKNLHMQWPNEAAYEKIKQAFSDFRKYLPERLALFCETPEPLQTEIEYAQRFLRVASEVVVAYQNRKLRAGIVDYQDMLVFARNLLRDRTDVRESLRQRYRFLLLDELQDTDPIQMELVELLCGVGLHHGKLFAVGDAKQSIYRFRGADVTLFQRLRATIREEGRLDLSQNFRSQPGILHFVNALFAQRMADYVPLEPSIERVQDRPVVEFLWSVPDADAKKPTAQQCREHEADAIAARIAALLNDPTARVYDRESQSLRRIVIADIVLLFRSMSNVSIYESALRRQGLDYYLIGGRAFFAQQEIYDLYNLLRTLENPEDSLSLAGTLRSPFCCLSDESLFILGFGDKSLWLGLFDDSRLQRLVPAQQLAASRARRFLSRWRDRKDRISIACLLGEIFADSGYDAAMQFEFLGDRKLANLWKLIDLARSFDRSGMFGLGDFIQQLGELVQNQPREEQAATLPENAAVIKLMSIHQSKGLEFPVVFIPDLAASTRGNRQNYVRWHREYGALVNPPSDEPVPPFPAFGWAMGDTADTLADWQEELRSLYVACTRARDLLILSAGLSEPFAAVSTSQPVVLRSPNTWMMTLTERFHLVTGACMAADLQEQRRPDVAVRIVAPQPQSMQSFVPHQSVDVWNGPLPKPPQSSEIRFPAVVSLPLACRWDRWFPGRDWEPNQISGSVFDGEDGFESCAFRPLRERQFGDCRHPQRSVELMLWSVLRRWDFRVATGWQILLEQARTGQPGDDTERHCESYLAAFAGTELRLDLAKAKECHREVEFLVDGSAVRTEAQRLLHTSTVELPQFWGLVDFLWKDATEAWHLARIDLVPERMDTDARRVLQDELTIQRYGVEQSLGQVLQSVQLLELKADMPKK